jgi:hypothetical protein
MVSVAKMASVELMASPEARAFSLPLYSAYLLFRNRVSLEPIVHFKNLNIIFFLKIIGFITS